MAVIGIDFGTLNNVMASPIGASIDIVLNGSSNRVNPCLVSYQGSERFIGESASSHVRTNWKNTVKEAKRLLGRHFSDPSLQDELPYLPFTVVEMPGDRIGVEVTYCDETEVIPIEGVVAAILGDLKEISVKKTPGVTARDVVIAVPQHWTDSQRVAMLNAAHIAGMNPLRLINETTAAALDYGIYKSLRGIFHESERTFVAFVDMGYASFNVTIASFVQGELKIEGSASDSNLGGRDFDRALAAHFAAAFKAKRKVDVYERPKSVVKLLTACEKLKKLLSPKGVTVARNNVECLWGDFDFALKISLDEFVELVSPLTDRIAAVVGAALADSGVEPSALAAVELLGGATRVQCVKQAIAHAFGVFDADSTNYGLNTTLNADEAIARGAAMQCAMLSPLKSVPDFIIREAVRLPISLHWDAPPEGDDSAATSVCVFERNHVSPKDRRTVFYRGAPFTVRAAYDEHPALPAGADSQLGEYTISGMPEEAVGGGPPKIRVIVRHDLNGIFSVAAAVFMREVVDEEKKESSKEADAADGKDGGDAADGKEDGDDSSAAAAAAAAAAAVSDDGAAKKKKKKFVQEVITVEGSDRGMTTVALTAARDRELQMANQDRLNRERSAARNDLESYVYNMRDKLDSSLGPYVSEEDKAAFLTLINEVGDWLYTDEGFDSAKKVFTAKLSELMAVGNPISSRAWEDQQRPAAASNLLAATEYYKRIAGSMEPQFDHLTPEDRSTVKDACAAAEAWLMEKQGEQDGLPLTVPPVLTVSAVAGQRTELDNVCKPIVTKPKPKPKPKKEAKEEGKEGDAKEGGDDAAAADGDAAADAPADGEAASESGDAPVGDDPDATD